MLQSLFDCNSIHYLLQVLTASRHKRVRRLCAAAALSRCTRSSILYCAGNGSRLRQKYAVKVADTLEAALGGYSGDLKIAVGQQLHCVAYAVLVYQLL